MNRIVKINRGIDILDKDTIYDISIYGVGRGAGARVHYTHPQGVSFALGAALGLVRKR